MLPVILASFFIFIKSLIKMLREPEFRSLFTLVILILTLGTTVYHSVEGWNWLDSLYFSVIVLTTIGFGDFVPVTDLGKMFTILYVFMGLGALLGFVNASGEYIRKQQQEKRSRIGQSSIWDSGDTMEKMERDILENIRERSD